MYSYPPQEQPQVVAVTHKVDCTSCDIPIGIGEIAFEIHTEVVRGPLTFGERTGRIMASDKSPESTSVKIDFIGHVECFEDYLVKSLYEAGIYEDDYQPERMCVNCGEALQMVLCPCCTDEIYGLTCVKCGNKEEGSGV